MPGRGSNHRGRPSISSLGKRRRTEARESAESENDPRVSGRGRGRGRHTGARATTRGRNQGPSISQKGMTAVRDKLTTTTTTTTSNKTSVYDPAFTQHLLDHNILSVVHRSPGGRKPKPPDNLLEIKAELDTVRTQDPLENFERFSSDYERCSNEEDAATLLDKIQGDNAALCHIIRKKTKMGKLAPLTDGDIPPGNPDRAYGAAAAELHREVRRRLEDLIVPTPDKDFICPNFMVHAKSDSGSTKVARGQASYDGALAARGMQALWDFGNASDDRNRRIYTTGSRGGRRTAMYGDPSDNLGDEARPAQRQAQVAGVARTITCTWASGVLKMYATYREPDPDTGEEPPSDGLARPEFPKYVSSLIGSWIMTDAEDQFRRGLTAYRNGLDWAKRQRDEVIRRANARIEAERARRRLDGEENPGGEDVSDEQDNSESRGDLAGTDWGSESISARRASETGYQHEEDQSESEDNHEDRGAGSSSIFATRRSDAREQDEEDEDNEIFESFDSQRTIRTRSMSRIQSKGTRP